MKKRTRQILSVLVAMLLLGSMLPPAFAEYQAPEVLTDSAVMYLPENTADTGFIFYCGAFVDYRDYCGILGGLADRGYFTASLKCPADISMLNPAGALVLMRQHPEIRHWYIGGHSMGGVVASSLSGLLPSSFEGVVLLASYSIVPVRVPVLSIYGTNDGVLVMPLYMASRPLISSDLTEIVMEGANHRQFGNYAYQIMDREASISMETQQQNTICAIDAFIRAHRAA